jgi:hypothetical protein
LRLPILQSQLQRSAGRAARDGQCVLQNANRRGGLANATLTVRETGQPLAPESNLPIELLATPPGERVFIANQQTRLFAKAPQTLDVFASALAGGVMKGLRCTITGDRLVPE